MVRMCLPSGAVVRLERMRGSAPVAEDSVDGRLVFGGRALAALLDPARVRAELRARDARSFQPLDRALLESLELRDYHALRDLLARVGAISIDPQSFTCRNCDAPITIDFVALGSSDLPTRFEGEPASPEGPFALGRVVRLPRGARATTFSMRPVTVRDAIPLWTALGGSTPAPLRITPPIVAALGIDALGPATDRRVIARVLSRVSEDVWANVVDQFLRLSYSSRAFVPRPCEACGALHEIPAPPERELDGVDGIDGVAGVGACAAFPAEDEFESLVERIAPLVYEDKGVRNIAIRVDPGIPAVDDGGEPLLGSYEPTSSNDLAIPGGGAELEFLITLYYRTFRRMHEEDGPYDVEAEIRETIEHEVQHHLYYLEGDDPMAAEEQAEIREDLATTFGDRELRRIALRDAAAEIGRFARFALPLLLLFALVLAALHWLGVL